MKKLSSLPLSCSRKHSFQSYSVSFAIYIYICSILYNIVGFLRPGLQPSVISNFGLLDQVAAIHWLKENIKQFRGDPNSITLVGHGTGAAMVSLLLTSPVAQASEGMLYLSLF